MAMVIGFPWFAPEDYQELRRCLSDGPLFPDTFREWKARAVAAFRLFQEQDLPVTRVRIRPREFRVWCKRNCLRPDHRARQTYAAERLAQPEQIEAAKAPTRAKPPARVAQPESGTASRFRGRAAANQVSSHG